MQAGSKVGILMVALAAGSPGLAVVQGAPAEQVEHVLGDPREVVDVNVIDLPQGQIRSLELSGNVAGSGIRFSVSVKDDEPNQVVHIKLTSEQHVYDSVRLPYRNYNNVDIASLRTYGRCYKVTRCHFTVTVEHGPEKQCIGTFLRSRLAITFAGSMDPALRDATLYKCKDSKESDEGGD